MFQLLSNIAARYKYAVIIVWVGLAVILLAVAPDLESVSTTDQKDFLPGDAPFVHAQEVFEAKFPQEFTPSSTIILIDAGEGHDAHDPEIWAYMQKLETWLNSDAAPDNIENVVAPTTDPDFADALISPDKRIALVSAGLNTPTDAAVTTEAVQAIDDWLEANEPEGFDVYQTGEAGLNAQAETSTFTTMDRTVLITIALVIIALLVIYRSPVSPIIPLFTVTMALFVTVGCVSLLAKANVINVVAQINAILVVVIYGAGTDYCLFLISRFREEMANEIGAQNATRRTVRMVGETISSSAATIFVGFLSLSFAEMGAFKSAGPMLAIGVAVTLLAGLTLAPAMLAALGNRAFWPGKASHRAAGRLYETTSKLVSTHPAVTIVVIVAIMVPLSIYGLSRELNYDFVSELPEGIPSVKAYNLLREHMGGGNLFPLSVIVTGRNPEQTPADISRLTDELLALDEVVDVRGLNHPLGVNDDRFGDLLRVDGQLSLLLALDEGESGANAAAIDPQQAMQVIGGVERYMDLIAERFPEVADDANVQTAREIVGGGLLRIMAEQDRLMEAVKALIARFEAMEAPYLMPPTGEGEMFALLKPLVDAYIADDGATFRLDVVLDEPLSAPAIDAVSEIRALLAGYAGEGDAVVSGYPAIITDIHDTMNRDNVRAFGFVLAGIFIVLVIMLRSLVAPIYLIATVVLSFTSTLGLTSLFFNAAYGIDRLSWMLPLFTFTFLVGLGIDYSIFLFGRIKEEVAHHGTREGIHVAVATTGAIITSAGVILAGTFAGMMAGEIRLLAQLGFAVSIGVLIDTFVVRTMLVPALATLFGRWTWWPGGVPKVQEPAGAAPASVSESAG